jgi:hypothetical protein
LSLFEFLMVPVSLIIGLGITELLTGVALTIRYRKSIAVYWGHSIFVVIVFLALVQQWWEIWNLRDTPSWSFPGCLMMRGGPIGLYLIAHLLYPEPVSNADFRKYYYEEMRPIFLIALLTVLVTASFSPLIIDQSIFQLDNLSSFVLPLVFTALALSQNSRLHAFLVPMILLGSCGHTAGDIRNLVATNTGNS